MKKQIDGTHYLIMYLTGYGFFSYQVYTQLLYSYYGLHLVIPFCIAFLFFPLLVLYVCKKINKRMSLEHKTKFVFNILTIIYLIVVSIIAHNYASVMIHNYYYQSTKTYIITFFLLLPTIYVLFKSSKIYYSLAFIIFSVFLLFNFLYIINHETVDFYPLYNTLFINNPYLISLIALPIILEPIILLSNTSFIDSRKKINVKLIMLVSCLISILAIYTIIRQSMEFGLLIETISFPYFESGKFMSIKSNFDNIDYYYLFLIAIALFSRIPILYFNIKDNFNVKKTPLLIIFGLTLITHYYIQKKLEFYRTIIIPILIVSSSILVILTIISLFNKRRKKYAD